MSTDLERDNGTINQTMVALDVRLSFDECAALRDALTYFNALMDRGVMRVTPPHAEHLPPAMRKVLESLASAEEWARAEIARPS